MADIDLKKKSSKSPLVWLALAAVVAIVVIVILVAGIAGTDEKEAEVGEGEPAADVSEPGMFPVSDILADPEAWEGRTVAGQARVADVPTDRGFWIEENGERVFVVLDPEGPPGSESDIHVQEDQQLRIQDAKVVPKSRAGAVSGQLDEETRQIIDEQLAFLVVDAEDVRVL